MFKARCGGAEAILEVVCSTFNVESSCVAVSEHHDRVYFWAGSGMCKAGSHSIWAKQFINRVLSTSNHEIIIVEDASIDARCNSRCMCILRKSREDTVSNFHGTARALLSLTFPIACKECSGGDMQGEGLPDGMC